MSETTTDVGASAPAMDSGASTPAPAETTAQPPASGATETQPDAADPSSRNGVKSRIDELTALRRQAERDRDHWREVALRGQPQQQPAKSAEPEALPPHIAAQIGPPPKPSDFAYGDMDPSYSAALAEHRIMQRLAREAVQQDRVQSERQVRRAADAITENLRKGEAQYPGLRDAAENLGVLFEEHHRIDLTWDVGEAGPAVVHHYANNEAEALKLARMPRAQALREIGRVEARLEAQRAAKAVSNAPEPPATVTGRGGASSDWRKATDMDRFAAGYRKDVLKFKS